MRIVFMGTPEFAVPSLETLAKHHQVVLVVTRPDAVRGRGKKLEPSPVKACAQKLGLPVLEATRMDEAAKSKIAEARPELIAVAAYGCILPDDVINMAPYGCINVHASLLPRWRGAAPIQRGIMAGDKEAGVSIMKVVKALDAGDYCRQAAIPAEGKNCRDLLEEVGELGAEELLQAIDEIRSGTAVWHRQDESQVTLAPKVTKDEMRLKPDMTAAKACAYVHASTDAAPARVEVCGKGVRILSALDASAYVRAAQAQLGPGEVQFLDGRLFLGFADGALELLQVKPDGKAIMMADAFARGLRDLSEGWTQLS